MKAASIATAQSNALALAVANPGALGTIDAYISTVNRLPVLSAERETDLQLQRCRRGHDDRRRHGGLAAAEARTQRERGE